MAGRRVLMVVALILAAVLLAFLHGPAPTPPALAPSPVTPPAQQPVEAPVRVNVTQPAEQPAEQARLIVAVVEAGEGGRVLVNGTEAFTWNSTRPFSLVLEAVPGRCVALDYWLVNGSARLPGNPLTLTIAGNTTVRAVFARPLRTVTIAANATGAETLVNGTPYRLPASLAAPACSLLVVEPLETPLLKPLNTTLTVAVESDARITLSYRLRVRAVLSAQILVGGKPARVDAAVAPFGNIYMPSIFEVAEDGWMHIRANSTSIDVYVPWNLTRVVIEVRLVEGGITVMRYCEWDSEVKGYQVPMGPDQPVLEFIGCKPSNLNPGVLVGVMSGKRYPFEVPGAVRLSLFSPYGEADAWVRITAYP